MDAVKLSQGFAWIEVEAGSWVGFVMASFLVAASFLVVLASASPLGRLGYARKSAGSQRGRPLFLAGKAAKRHPEEAKGRRGSLAPLSLARSLTFLSVALATTSEAKCPLGGFLGRGRLVVKQPG